jgi:6-phosphofructo-2-kinase
MRRDGKLLIAMVGLPARGKTYIAKRIKRHLDWLGIHTQMFNAGNYRRQGQCLLYGVCTHIASHELNCTAPNMQALLQHAIHIKFNKFALRLWQRDTLANNQ